MKLINTEVLGLGLNSGVDLGTDCSVGLNDLEDAFSSAVGKSAIAGVDFSRKHKGTIKGLAIGAGWSVLIAANGASSPDAPSKDFMETFVSNPFWVMASGGVVGSIWGFIYSSYRGVEAYKKQERDLSGDVAETIRQANEGKVSNMLEIIEEKVKAGVEKEKDPIKAEKMAKAIRAELKLANSTSAFADADPLEKFRKVTAKTIGREIIYTVLHEGLEGLDIGVKLALIPAYFYTQSKVNAAYILEAQKQGANFEKLMNLVLTNNAQTIGVLVLGAGALVADIKKSLEQRILQFGATPVEQ